MGTISIENFSGGIDRTRPIYALPNGRLWSGSNGHISRGGDVEKRKSFVSVQAMPAGTFGLFQSNSFGLVVFGSIATPAGFPFTIPGLGYLEYIRCQNPITPASPMIAVESCNMFNGGYYCICTFFDGNSFHFYNGVVIADWYPGGVSKPTYNHSKIAQVYKRKVYAGISGSLNFSSLDQPTHWDYSAAGLLLYPGAGFLSMQDNVGGIGDITGMAVYKSQLAVFMANNIQLWSMDANPALNAPAQVIQGTGSVSKNAIVGFGDYDVIYVSQSGIRSLKSADYGGTANVFDIGTPIDTLIQSITSTLVADAKACLEPTDGRLWVCIDGKIYVYSYFPSKKIAAWTVYDTTAMGITITDLAVVARRTFCRAGDTVYAYGGMDGSTYDSTIASMQLPYVSMREQAAYKQIVGFDAAVSGTWAVKLYVDPNDQAQYVDLGTIEKVTYNQPNIGSVGYGTHVSPVLTSSGSGAASVSSVALHYHGGEHDTGIKR